MVDTNNSSTWFNFCWNLVKFTPDVKISKNFVLHNFSKSRKFISTDKTLFISYAHQEIQESGNSENR